MKTYAYGFPRLGKNREFKKIIEDFWKEDRSESQVQQALLQLQGNILATYEKSVDQFPVGEMTAYDLMLDMAIMAGLYTSQNLKDYFELCRGKNALEMTKWFNTNYHYLVPRFDGNRRPQLRLARNKSAEYFHQFKKGIPFFIGPATFLKLSKGVSANRFKNYLFSLAHVYKEAMKGLPEVHMEEPVLVTDLKKGEIELIKKAYQIMGEAKARIYLITYYESVDFLKEIYDWPVAAIGLDFVHGSQNLKQIKEIGFPEDKTLIAGVIDGRNVWKADSSQVFNLCKELSHRVKHISVSNAGPLYHLPITVEEERFNPELMKRLSFAKEKLEEIKAVAQICGGKYAPRPTELSPLGVKTHVRQQIKSLTKEDFQKNISYSRRKKIHKGILNLPIFPTTTIGSFPQTKEVRKMRADYRSGKISQAEYDSFVKEKIREVIRFQEEIGLDVLVHGEFERTDMVEFFAEKLEGIAPTQAGWIISYGTRTYRPPIIFGDVARTQPMTVSEISFAQSLTPRPVKGMLTGAVTIIAWSFVREDIPIKDVAYQISLSLREEIKDYEKIGIKIVQVDEPAIREKAPIKKKDWFSYFDWAIKSFRLATNTNPHTQIHTHMCYSEFGEIIKQVNAMDFDVISIETARSKGDIIENFEKINFQRQIGLGVWDIHSPHIPTVQEMNKIVHRALEVIPKENFWLNPDCGLKTRGWPETEISLKNLNKLSRILREGKKK